MRIDQFDYSFDDSLIAHYPLERREDARLLVGIGGAGKAVDSHIHALPQWIPQGSLLLINDTKVIPARLLGIRKPGGGKAEVFLIRKLSDGVYLALTRASKALRPGAQVCVGPLTITVERRHDDGTAEVHIVHPGLTGDTALLEALELHGQVPLPPYIDRPAEVSDRARYQTVFAKNPGAVAAPTAGLHLTDALFTEFSKRSIEHCPITLHVGLGTFQPVTTDDLDQHPMHEEFYAISEETACRIADARNTGRPIVAVGTTVVRAVESHALQCLKTKRPLESPTSGNTRLLIQPGFNFRVVDMLMTNFHVPKSTLLALVCAFAGQNEVLRLYAHAVAHRYRFFSYGDAMLLTKDSNAP
jgi:S-adenosylmethionine:tRNA ribosyltransferase-isomerase